MRLERREKKTSPCFWGGILILSADSATDLNHPTRKGGRKKGCLFESGSLKMGDGGFKKKRRPDKRPPYGGSVKQNSEKRRKGDGVTS